MLSFGVSFLPDATPATMSPADYYRQALEVCERADRLGVEYVKMTEHYLSPYGAYCPNPLMFLSAVAARTSRIRLMTGGIMASFHHPIQIATHASMLDAISGGRADIGFARAWLPHEFDLFEISMDESRARFVDTVDAVTRIWTESDVEVKSPFFSFSGVNLLPETVQRPHPPVWVAAVQSAQSFEWIAERGFGLLVTPGLQGYGVLAEHVRRYREVFAATHGDAARPRVALSLPAIVAESHARAVELSDLHLGRYLSVWLDAATAWDDRESADYARYSGLARVLAAETPAGMRDRVAAVVGGPREAAEQIAHIRGLIDPDVLLWQIDTGAQPLDVATETLGLLTQRIRPALV